MPDRSKWVIGSNVTKSTKSCDILRIGKNVLKLPLMELYRCPKRHSLPHSVFCDGSKLSIQSHRSAMFCATAQVQSSNAPRSLGPITKNIIDKEHDHVCGHFNYTNIKTILQRNVICDRDVLKYLGKLLSPVVPVVLHHCPGNHGRCLSALCRVRFNKDVCIDDFS